VRFGHGETLEAHHEQVDQRKDADQKQHEDCRPDQQVSEIAVGEGARAGIECEATRKSVSCADKKGAPRSGAPTFVLLRLPSGEPEQSASFVCLLG